MSRRWPGLLLAVTFCAHAQEPAQEPAADAPPPEAVETIPVEPVVAESAPAEGEPTQLEDLVVTSTKRATSLRDIPASISVLDGEKLEREGILGIDQIVTLVPGVNLNDEGTGGESKRITIRGISTTRGANPTTGMLIGDMPFADPFGPKVPLDPSPFDMATVEILKGPQGTLFGGTGLNGMIRYVPEAPQLDEFRVKYFTQYQSFDTEGGTGWSYGGVINAPFADHQAAVRLMAFTRDTPGYTDDTQNGIEDVNSSRQYGVRGMATWLPADRWKLSLMGALQETEDDDVGFTDNYEGRLEHGNMPRQSPAKYSYLIGNFGVERAFDWGDVTSQTSYFKKDFQIFIEASRATGGQAEDLAGANDLKSDGIVQELRAVSAPGDSPWKWLVGGFYYDMNLFDCSDIGAAESFVGIPPDLAAALGLLAVPCPGNAPRIQGQLDIGQLKGDIKLREEALFGELSRELGELVEVTLGARAYRIETEGTVSFSGLLYTSANQGQTGSRPAETSEDGVSPKLSLVYQPTDDIRTYMAATRGFRFGGPQLAAATLTSPDVPASYRSDSLWNYEVGLRTDWLDRSLRADLSAYHINWKDAQLFQLTADGLTNYIDNVGGVKSEGVELALRYVPPFLPGLSLDAVGAWSETVTTTDYESPQLGTIEAGSPWAAAPRWQTSTTLAYLQPIASWQAGGSLRHAYLSEACNAIGCQRQIFGFDTLDATVFASAVGDSWWPQLSVTVANLTDERGVNSITVNPQPAGDTITYVAPRSLVVRLSGSF